MTVSLRKRVETALKKEFIRGTVFRVDLDRVDVAPAGSPGILRSLPLTGDRDKIKPGDPVQIITVGGERVALAEDVATDLTQLPQAEVADGLGLEVPQVVDEGLSEGWYEKAGFTFVMDGSGQNIATGLHGYVQFPFPMRFTNVDLLASGVGNVTVAIAKTTYATWGTPVSVGSLSIASANKNTYDLDSAWEVAEGDLWSFDLTVNSASALISLCFRGYKL